MSTTLHGEAAHVDEGVMGLGRHRLHRILASYTGDKISDVGETGSSYRLKPPSTLQKSARAERKERTCHLFGECERLKQVETCGTGKVVHPGLFGRVLYLSICRDYVYNKKAG